MNVPIDFFMIGCYSGWFKLQLRRTIRISSFYVSGTFQSANSPTFKIRHLYSKYYMHITKTKGHYYYPQYFPPQFHLIQKIPSKPVQVPPKPSLPIRVITELTIPFIQIFKHKFYYLFGQEFNLSRMDLRSKNYYYGNQSRIQQPINGFANFTSQQQSTFSTPTNEQKIGSVTFSGYGATQSNYSPSQMKGTLKNDSFNEKNFFDRKSTPTNLVLKTEKIPENRNSYGVEPTQKYELSQSGSKNNNNLQFDSNTEKNVKPKQNGKEGDPNSLSWTKYVGMELKIEELQNTIRSLQLDVKSKSQKIQELERSKLSDKNSRLQQADMIQRKYRKQLQEQKSKNQMQLNAKKVELNEMIDKVADQTKKGLSHEIKSYIQQILNKNVELEVALQEEKAKNIQLTTLVAKFESEERLTKEESAQRQERLEKMAIQLEMVTNKILYRVNYSSQSASFIEVIQAQSNQITQLRANFEALQNQYLKNRSTTSQIMDQLKTSQNEQRSKLLKEKQELNALLADLGFKLTQKQSESNHLNRKVQTLERKYKEATEQHRSKIDNIENFIKNNYKYLENSCVESVIKTMQIKNHCSQCLKSAEQIENLKQKLSLFIF